MCWSLLSLQIQRLDFVAAKGALSTLRRPTLVTDVEGALGTLRCPTVVTLHHQVNSKRSRTTLHLHVLLADGYAGRRRHALQMIRASHHWYRASLSGGKPELSRLRPGES